LSKRSREMLQGMPVFGGISEQTLGFLLQLADTHVVASDHYFFHEGDNATSMFVLEEGRAAVLKSRDGNELEIDQLEQGDCFGEMALLDLYPRSCSIRAIGPCKVKEISQLSLFKLYEQDLEQFTIIQMNIGREISRRLRLSSEKLFQSHETSSNTPAA